jgi:hypothetical protein
MFRCMSMKSSGHESTIVFRLSERSNRQLQTFVDPTRILNLLTLRFETLLLGCSHAISNSCDGLVSLHSPQQRLQRITDFRHCRLHDTHSDGHCPRYLGTIRTARSRTSVEDLLDLFIAPSSQELESPQNLERFNLHKRFATAMGIYASRRSWSVPVAAIAGRSEHMPSFT